MMATRSPVTSNRHSNSRSSRICANYNLTGNNLNQHYHNKSTQYPAFYSNRLTLTLTICHKSLLHNRAIPEHLLKLSGLFKKHRDNVQLKPPNVSSGPSVVPDHSWKSSCGLVACSCPSSTGPFGTMSRSRSKSTNSSGPCSRDMVDVVWTSISDR